MGTRICPSCGKAILVHEAYQICGTCKRNYHINHRCPAHPESRVIIVNPPIPERPRHPTPPQRPVPAPPIVNPPDEEQQIPQPSTETGSRPDTRASFRPIILLVLGCLIIFAIARLAPRVWQEFSQRVPQTPARTIDVIAPATGYPSPTSTIFSESTQNDELEVMTPNSNAGKTISTCPGAIQQRLSVESKARVCVKWGRVNMRMTPGLSGFVIKSIDPNTYLRVVDGPVCLNHYSWWKVQTESGLEGWIAEGDNSTSTYYICPENIEPTNNQVPTLAIAENSRLSPEQFIREYYSLINQREYRKTWAMLSDNFKRRNHCCKSDGSFDVGPYKEWWNSIDHVEVLKVETRTWNNEKASIDITIRYYREDGHVVDSTHTFNLIRDSSGKSWLID